MSDEGFDHNGDHYSLDFPFVTTKSMGGLHDDASYVAGYEMGSLSAMLTAIASWGQIHEIDITIHAANTRQADLILAHHRWHAEVAIDPFEPLELSHDGPRGTIILAHRKDGPDTDWIRLLCARDTEDRP